MPSHGEVTAHGVADDITTFDTERALQRDEPVGQTMGAMVGIRGRLTPPGSWQIRGITGEVPAERLERITPRVARRHQTVNKKQGRSLAKYPDMRPKARPPGACWHPQLAAFARIEGMREPRPFGKFRKTLLLEGSGQTRHSLPSRGGGGLRLLIWQMA